MLQNLGDARLLADNIAYLESELDDARNEIQRLAEIIQGIDPDLLLEPTSNNDSIYYDVLNESTGTKNAENEETTCMLTSGEQNQQAIAKYPEVASIEEGLQNTHVSETNVQETINLIYQILESTKTVEEAANLVPERDKEKESESQRKTIVTPQPIQPATSTVSTSSSAAESTIVIDVAANLSSAESDQEPSRTVSITTPSHDPYSRFIACSNPSSTFSSDLQYTFISLWTGNINIVGVTSFQLSLQPIVGNSTGLAKLLPNELNVVGRIGPDTVWDYISRIKKSPNKEIVVIRLIPANESQTVAYKILYEYLDNRKRLGVIQSTSSQMQDLYIYPLGAGKHVPSLLQPSEPVEFYEDPYRPDVLIGIIVRVVISKRPNPIPTKPALGVVSTTSTINKLTNRSNDLDTFNPPGSPKPKKRRPSSVSIAPIAAKIQKDKPTGSNTNSTSLLAKLSEAELLSMVPDDIVIVFNKSTRYEEPPPPGV